ncbi:DUF6708 domain-containing protein, partial [Neptuniibacter sp. UBA6509]|uniref:DUF6708 domain-containing protein n=1 Tax=Neptuniibacter sp. UBA6509 TaxID=1946976 RepID=UPI0025E77E5A|tara:strand:- start:487 stop:1332 length:846 start_codon:yes stop_codon:yes gene_type:complete
MKRIDTSNPSAWIAPKYYGYAPVFKDTKARRGNGLGTAFGKGVVMEDVLHPPSKQIPREEELQRVHEKGCLLFGAGNHNHYMDMRVNSVTNREMLTRFAQFILLPLYIVGYLIIRFTGALEWGEFMFVDWGFIITIAALILYDFLKPIATPVRFNYKKQEVYAYHKGALYRIPWDECEIACMYAPDFMGVGGLADAYSLNLWLYPKHCVNGKAGTEPLPLVLNNTGEVHSDNYDYWEYVRAYMTDGPENVYTYDDKYTRARLVKFAGASPISLAIELPLIF